MSSVLWACCQAPITSLILEPLARWSGVALVASMFSWAMAAPLTVSDEQRLDRVRASLVDIELELLDVKGQVSGASGFVAGRTDWVVTNVHALDWALFHTDEYRFRVKGAQGQRLLAEVLAIDLANDLVVLQTGRPMSGTPLKVISDLPAKGALMWAIGNAGGDGFVVHRGTHAGLEPEQKAIAPSMQFHGEIQPGMSGGPVLDDQGRVVGVNRARNVQNNGLGYLVPGRVLMSLLEQARSAPYSSPNAMVQDLQRQYRAFAKAHVDRWTAKAVVAQRIGPFEVPVGFAEDACMATRYNRPTERFVVYRLNCQSPEYATFVGDLDLAMVKMRLYWITNPWHGDLKSARASAFMMRYLREEELPETREHKHWLCRYSRVRNAAGLNLDLQACRRPYLRLEGFHDYRMRASLEVYGPDALVTALDINGMDEANARRLTQHWLDQMRWPQSPSSGREGGVP